ncbi:MAG TPA: hypothetical protein VF927_04225, partial [Solirubrobacteraceae bacterium]
LVGCGSSRSHPADHQTLRIVGPSSSSVVDLCFVLKARLEGVEHVAAIIDPEPAALRGRLPAERVARASREAIALSRESASELRHKHPPAGSLRALRSAERGYRRLGRRLRGASAADPAAGLQMQAAFLRIAGAELQGCLRPS